MIDNFVDVGFAGPAIGDVSPAVDVDFDEVLLRRRRLLADLRRKYDLVNPDALASKSVAVSMTLSQGKAGFGTTWSLLRGMFDDPDKSKVAGQLRQHELQGVWPPGGYTDGNDAGRERRKKVPETG